jgi:hypothetical protein
MQRSCSKQQYIQALKFQSDHPPQLQITEMEEDEVDKNEEAQED